MLKKKAVQERDDLCGHTGEQAYEAKCVKCMHDLPKSYKLRGCRND